MGRSQTQKFHTLASVHEILQKIKLNYCDEKYEGDGGFKKDLEFHEWSVFMQCFNGCS